MTIAGAQTRGWQWQNPRPQGNPIHAIRFAADKKHGLAVGADGSILRTDDGGFDWEVQRSPVVTTLYGLYVKDRKRAVAVGARGVILTTNDGGGDWKLRASGTKDHLYAVTFSAADPERGWAVGTYGSAVATTDGGTTWSAMRTPVRTHLYGVAFANKTNGAAVGERGTLL
ncbi:MAG TPA: YCF48-related protein, partial [Pyrinomonadaceae bacterium]|nr:YCF48-related protein [Pyrinomonadaceae bacterium]